MKLFLASKAVEAQTLQKLESFIGRNLSNLNIAYIPTAANGEYFGSWKSSSSLEKLQVINPNLKIVELESYFNQDIFQPLQKADVIWFAGGMAGYLMYWIRRSELDIALPDLLSQDKIYVGSSAGSMVAGPSLYSAENYIGEEESGASKIPGLGLIDFEIYPHYDEAQYNEIEVIWHKVGKGKLCLLKDGDAVTVVDGKVEVLGQEKWF